MSTLGMLATPGTWSMPGQPLVGRTVANAQFLKALLTYSRFDEIAIFIGETADLASLEKLTENWDVAEERLAAYSLWQLPELLARGRIDVMHHASHGDRLVDLLAARNRYAGKPVSVTGQIHSLSYPRFHQELSRQLLIPPSRGDALFCSSTAGRGVIEKSFERLHAEAKRAGFTGAAPSWDLPVVPLGIEFDALQGGDRAAARRALEIPDGAVLLTCLARFTEFDKLDLFPLIRVLERLVREPGAGMPPVYLLLAGARQGTKTPEMLELWAKHLGVADRLRLRVDFADGDKKQLLAASDVFVSPVDNIQETFGQSVIEAMAAGLPVIASDFDGYKDTVDETVGVRIPTRNHSDWSELSELGPLLYERPLHLVLGQSIEVDLSILEKSIRELASDAARRQQLGAAARERARTRYDWKAVIRRYEEEWTRLLGVAARPSGASHPLQLDFGAFFGHFTTTNTVDATQRVMRSERADDFVIYPELKHLFVEEDVRALLQNCTAPKTIEQLTTEMRQRLVDRRPWIAGFVVGWLLKQGLLRSSAA
ncbi:MAG: glycosyltransferase family 4 protein [Archangium sp.]|nr:glycosyltransferase family 4 protein [Archangium sp.]